MMPAARSKGKSATPVPSIGKAMRARRCSEASPSAARVAERMLLALAGSSPIAAA